MGHCTSRIRSKAKKVARQYGITVDSNCHYDFLIKENFYGFAAENPLAEYLYGDKAFNSRLDMMPDGDLYPNYEFFGLHQFKLGNVFETPIKDLRNSAYFNSLKDNALNLPKSCLGCEFKDICKGGFVSRKVKFHTENERPEYCPLIDEKISVALINETYDSIIN